LAKFVDLYQTVSEFLINILQVTCQTEGNRDILFFIVKNQHLTTKQNTEKWKTLAHQSRIIRA